MEIRPYTNKDWNSVKKIYNISKPDECKGSVDLRAIIPLENDENFLKLFRESTLIVMEENNKVIGFVGNKGNYISWMFVDPENRRIGFIEFRPREEIIVFGLKNTANLNYT